MLASMSSILKDAMVPQLQAIIGKMVECLQSDEGIKVVYLPRPPNHTHFLINLLYFTKRQSIRLQLYSFSILKRMKKVAWKM